MFDDEMFLEEEVEFITSPLDKVKINIDDIEFEVDISDH